MPTKKRVAEPVVIRGFKGFDSDMKCRGFQFKEGGTYTEDDAVICQNGFHFCENPLDVFGYYTPGMSRYATVEGSGKTAKHEDDSKVACSNLHVEAEISIHNLVDAGVKFVLDHCKSTNKGSNTGYQSAATNTGYYSAATNTGYRSAASVEGNDSIACGLGYGCRASGALGCWIVLAERDDDYKIISVNTAKVDGKKIKANTFYRQENGKFVEA